jgi:hypothetical protein
MRQQKKPLFFWQGCKIKALRAKTNTYIKTPIRGESPMFVITGRREDVNMAKKEILSAAEHFSQIRARRNNSTSNNSTSAQVGNVSNQPVGQTQPSFNPTPSTSPSVLSSSSSTSSSSTGPEPVVAKDSSANAISASQTNLTQSATPSPPHAGQVTIQVRVPYKVVGLVVGPKGMTIKRIQQKTQTYIITPSRERDPVFEITGQSGNVDAAKAEIEAYIHSRTKSSFDDGDDEPDELDDYYLDADQLPSSTTSVLKSTLNDSTLDSFLNDAQPSVQVNEPVDTISSLLDYNPTSIWSNAPSNQDLNKFESEPLTNQNSLFNNIYRSTSSSSSSSSSSCSSSASVSLSSSTTNCPNQNSLQSLLLRTSPTQTQQQPLQLFDFSADGFFNDGQQQVQVEPIMFSDIINPNDASYMMQLMMQQAQQQHQQQQQHIPKCLICNINIGYETFDSETPALLLPCRHNMFCLNCAQSLVNNSHQCPLCYSNVTQAIRIYS